jgi:hypothetical protein
MMRHVRLLAGLLGATMILCACGAERPTRTESGQPAGERQVDYDSAAAWRLDPSYSAPTEDQSQIRVLVDGLACSGGKERTLRPPLISSDDEAVTVTFTVEPLPAGNYNCPGRPRQPYTVDLGEELGARRLVDGLCLASGPLVENVYCESDSGVRWKP